MKSVMIGLLFFSTFSCFRVSNISETSSSISSLLQWLMPSDNGEIYGNEVCSRWLVALLEIDRQMIQEKSGEKPQYRFGPNDDAIRTTYAQFVQNHVDLGITHKQKDFVSKAFPAFINECAKTRRAEYESCYPSAGGDDKKFQECANEHVEKFKMGVMLFYARSIKKQGYTDLGEYTDQMMQKIMREAVMNPTAFNSEAVVRDSK